MTSLTIAGSVLLQELAAEHPLDVDGTRAEPTPPVEGQIRQRRQPEVTPAVLEALARINDNVRRSHAWKQRATDVDKQGE